MVLVVSLSLFYGHKLDYLGELWMQLDTGVYLPVHDMIHTFYEQCKCLPFFHALGECEGTSSKRKHSPIGKKKAYTALKATSDEMLS